MKPTLTNKQEQFCIEYVKDFNGTQAALRAGYAEKAASVEGCRLLTNAKVSARIKELTAPALEAAGIQIADVVQKLSYIQYANLSDFIQVSENELTVKDFEELTEGQKAALSEISYTPGKYGTSIRVKLHSKLTASDQLMKHLGGYVTVEDLINRLTPEQVEEIAQKVLAKMPNG